MSDTRLRELERVWRTSRRLDDEVAFLKERLRLGQLTQERLALVSSLGHPAAVALTGDPGLVERRAAVEAAAKSLTRKELALWACEVGSRALQDLWDGDDRRPARVLAEVRRWIASPSEERKEAVWSATSQVLELTAFDLPAPTAASLVATLVAAAGGVVSMKSPSEQIVFTQMQFAVDLASLAWGPDAGAREWRRLLDAFGHLVLY